MAPKCQQTLFLNPGLDVVPDKSIGEQVADRAFEFYMRDVFKTAVAHVSRNNLEDARKIIREAYEKGGLVHTEMLNAAAGN